MLVTDKDALICDFAETYGIYDYESLPLSKVATFAVGLRENSRIKLKMNGTKYSFETMLLATIADRLAVMIWQRSKDGTNGINKPKSILSHMIKEKTGEDVETFDSPEDFERRRQEILRNGGI